MEDLLVGLCRFDQEAYSAFCDCYPQIAAGTAFNPMTNMDVVKLYQSVVDALVEQTEYSGINIIFDEFSKFLESNIDKSKMLNFKIIQDVAELASRSGKKQIHFTCITHKEILDYSSSDSFKTVEGRFKHIKFVASSEQSYELISNAIVKDASFAAFKKSHQAAFVEVCNKSSLIDVFSDLTPDSLEEKLLYGCFPLTPLSAYALLNISELVGQNERTLFTFLAQDGEFTFQDFLKKNTKRSSSLRRIIFIRILKSYLEKKYSMRKYTAFGKDRCSFETSKRGSSSAHFTSYGGYQHDRQRTLEKYQSPLESSIIDG